MSAEIFEDDGTLACLHLPADAANKRFFCREERQENLIGWLKYMGTINLTKTLNTFCYGKVF